MNGSFKIDRFPAGRNFYEALQVEASYPFKEMDLVLNRIRFSSKALQVVGFVTTAPVIMAAALVHYAMSLSAFSGTGERSFCDSFWFFESCWHAMRHTY